MSSSSSFGRELWGTMFSYSSFQMACKSLMTSSSSSSWSRTFMRTSSIVVVALVNVFIGALRAASYSRFMMPDPMIMSTPRTSSNCSQSQR